MPQPPIGQLTSIRGCALNRRSAERLSLNLSRRDIVRLWRLSGQRYQASPLDVLAATEQDYNMLDEFPEEYGEARASVCRARACCTGPFRRLLPVCYSVLTT